MCNKCHEKYLQITVKKEEKIKQSLEYLRQHYP